MKYIDADKLIANLERQNTDKKIIEPVIRIITSLQQEQPEVGKAANKYLHKWDIDGIPTTSYTWDDMVDCFRAGAEWQKKQDDELLTIAHLDGVDAGREAERKEMMKQAVEGRYMKTIDGECYVESSVFSPDGFVQVGGKVKIIVIK